MSWIAGVPLSLPPSLERARSRLRALVSRHLPKSTLLLLLLGLLFVAVAPDRRMGPYQAINPQSLARLFLVMQAISAAGYFAQRLLGARLGLTVLGFASGFLSSTATIAALGAQARVGGASWPSYAAGALASSTSTVLLYVVILAAVDLSIVSLLVVPLALATGAALLGTLALARLARRTPAGAPMSSNGLPIWGALGFVGVVCVVGVASAALHEWLGTAGIVLVSAAAALVDAHSTAGSVASLFHSGSLDAESARLAILSSLSANTLTKLLMAGSSRHLRFTLAVGAGVVLIALSAWLGLWWS